MLKPATLAVFVYVTYIRCSPPLIKMRYCSGLAYPRSCIFTRGKSVLYPWSSQLILPSSCPLPLAISHLTRSNGIVRYRPRRLHRIVASPPPQLVITHPSTASLSYLRPPPHPHPTPRERVFLPA